MDSNLANLAQIERLNQRGGRSLSIVDLIEAGTVSPRMAALCWMDIARGASFITGAVPGGVGKTTLMAALLAFLPPGETIVTVENGRVLDRATQAGLPLPATVLAHEIGAGHWYGYVWGPQAVEFFALCRPNVRRVTCLHADTPDQARDMLLRLGVSGEHVDAVSLQIYMCRPRFGRGARRVSSLHCRLGSRLRRIFHWQAAGDRFQPDVARAELCQLLAERYRSAPDRVSREWDGRESVLAALAQNGIRDYEPVRRAILDADV